MKAIESLSHVTIATPNPAATADDYARLLGLSPVLAGDGSHVFQTANIAVAIRPARPGEAPGLCDMTFRVRDLARARDELGRCGVPTVDGATPTLDLAATCGLPITLTAKPTASGTPSTIGLDHVVIRTRDPERAIAFYGGRLGLDMRLDRSNPAWKARLIFFRCGDLVVEIVHGLEDGVRDGPDLFGGLSWRVPDLDATHARLAREGFALSPVRPGRRSGSRVSTVRDRTGGVPTILLGVTPRGR